ncbi:hypothetical protein EVAR_103902_1 [Eumeta japonica]|uniref:Uncharacterized protein n=1 Tax=Eumeta variegata TaxID=151549 RepID=A0A4C2ACH6_EUMVA|nr:hypothetical protein EVAR_103902_1 [Eumeta japonica]
MAESILMIRIMQKLEGKTNGDDQPPVTSRDLPWIDPPFTGRSGDLPGPWTSSLVAAIKVIPKPARMIKPVQSLTTHRSTPVLGKTMERMLVGRLQSQFDVEATDDAVYIHTAA